MEPFSSLRSRIARAFNDEELRSLCFDHFPAVYSEFTIGMVKGQMIQLLLDHCLRRQAGSALLTVLEQERPGLIGPDREMLLGQLNTARLDMASPASPTGAPSGQTIINQAPNQGAQGHFYGPVYFGTPPLASYGSPASADAREEEIAQQQDRLKQWRGQLHGLLTQLAKLGSAWVPPGVSSGIREARAEIAKIKTTLRGWGMVVPDHPDDTP